MTRPQILALHERLEVDPGVTGRGVCIAFVDLGFYAHPDLARPARRLRAFIDVTRPRPAPRELVTPRSSAWHGTMTACTAAGNGYLSGGRYRGLAPEASVVLVKVGEGEAPVVHGPHVAAGIRAALDPALRVNIINVSLGVDRDEEGYDDVLAATREAAEAGVLVCAAAGNDPRWPVGAPAVSEDALAVGGVDDQNRRDLSARRPTAFSVGREKPDLLAPANLLPAPMLPGTLVAREAEALFDLLGVLEEEVADHAVATELREGVPRAERDGLASILRAVETRMARRKYILRDYQHVDGTSFASPVVAGVAAQMLEVAPGMPPAELRRLLVLTARRMDELPDELQGGGVVCPRAAVEAARKRRPARSTRIRRPVT